MERNVGIRGIDFTDSVVIDQPETKIIGPTTHVRSYEKDSLEISDDGSVVAVASKGAYTVRSFFWDENKWNEMGAVAAYSVAMTREGTFTAIGSPKDDTSGANRGK